MTTIDKLKEIADNFNNGYISTGEHQFNQLERKNQFRALEYFKQSKTISECHIINMENYLKTSAK